MKPIKLEEKKSTSYDNSLMDHRETEMAEKSRNDISLSNSPK
jgi:hypothetical protein